MFVSANIHNVNKGTARFHPETSGSDPLDKGFFCCQSPYLFRHILLIFPDVGSIVAIYQRSTEAKACIDHVKKSG